MNYQTETITNKHYENENSKCHNSWS